MRILLTGATGFVGRHLVGDLAARHDVVCLVRAPSADVTPAGTNRIVADLTDPALARRLPSAVDVVVHLAQAYRPFPDDAAELFAVNAGSTVALAEYGRRAGVRRVVLASSGSVYRPAREALRESAPTVPTAFHPTTKLMAEMALRHYEQYFGVATLRLFCPYGPGQVDRLVPRMIESVRGGRPVTLSRGGEPRINPIYVSDLVRVLAAAVEDMRSYTVNVAGPEALSIRDLAEIIGRHLDRAPTFVERDGEVAGDLVADTRLMEELFAVGPMMRPVDGLALTLGVGVPQAS
jgi:nucleoside-diphosphate-sugar epimerase